MSAYVTALLAHLVPGVDVRAKSQKLGGCGEVPAARGDGKRGLARLQKRTA
jgi:hypothetical protein